MHESACLDEVGLFDESLMAHEDWDLWIRMSRKFKFGHIKKFTCEFTWREDGSTMTSSKKKEMEATRRIVLDRGRGYQREENGRSSRRELTLAESKADSAYREILGMMKAGKIEEGVGALDGLLKEYLKHAEADKNLRVLYFRKRDTEKDLFRFEKEPCLNPENIALQKKLADFYYAELIRIEEAVSRYMEILSLRSGDTEILLLLGNIHAELKKFDEAQEFYHKVLEIDTANEYAGQMLEALKVRQEKGIPISEEANHEARLRIESGDIHAGIRGLTEITQVCPEYSLAHKDHPRREPFAKDDLRFPNAPSRNCSDDRKKQEGWEQQMLKFQKKKSQTVPFSVVIPAHNNREKLRLTLDCISQTDMDMSSLEVVVVDDGSTDGTYEDFTRQKYPFHFKIFARDFGGQSAATNEAIRQATGEYILSSAQDILFHKDIFKEHLRFHQKYSNQDIVVLGALPYSQQLEVTPFMFYLVNGGWQFAYYNIKDPLNVPPQFLYAPNFSIKREVLLRVGLFDEKFPFGSQDTDLGIRLAKAGVKIVYNPHAIGYHNHPIDLANFLRRQEMVGASLVRLHEKHPLCEDLLGLWDQVILNYLTFSTTQNDRCLDLIAQLETVYRKGEVDYESLWVQILSHNIPLSNFSEVHQKSINLTSLLFKTYDQILRSYWAKGFLKEALHFYGKKEVEEYLRGRLVKHQLSIQARRNANLRMRDHGLDVSLACGDYAISLIVYGVNNYRAATEFLKDFIGPLTKAFNYQVLFVLLENYFSQQELAKLRELADVVLCTNEDDGVLKAIQSSEAETICIITGKTKFDYGQVKVNAESYFSKNEQIAILWGSQTSPKSQGIKYTYLKGRQTPVKTEPCAKKSRLTHGAIEMGIPAFFLIRGSEIQQILTHYHQIPLWRRRRWFEDICSIVEDAGKIVYHLTKLTARMEKPVENSKLVSIIILTYNQLEYTKKCLDSIFRHTREPFELIIVDNGSTDGTVGYLNAVREGNAEVGGWKLKAGKDGEVVYQAEGQKTEKVNLKHKGKKKQRIEEKRRENGELACQYFKIIHNEKNQGFAKGCNEGIMEAKGELLLLLNNDVLVTENWLSGLLECLQSAKDIGIVGPMTNQISGIQMVKKVSYQSLSDLDTFAKRFREENRHRRIPCRRIVGFCMLFRRELVDRIGFLDESFGTGNFEDDDFCLRAELAGYKNMIAGDVFIHHFGSRSFIGNKIDYRKSMKGNHNHFMEKWNSLDSQSPEGKKYLSLRSREAAKLDYEKGQAKRAVERLLAVIRLGIKAKENYYELAELFLDAKQYDQAFRVLMQMPDADQDERKYALLGYCQEGVANPLEAQKLAEQALSLNPSNALALNLKGILSFRKGDKEEAEDYFQRAVAADPGFGEPQINLGFIRWEDNRQKEALQLFERGFILSPTVTDILQLYHTAVTQAGEFACAEQNFYEAKALHPFHQGIRFFLIDILLKQEKYKAAMEEIEQAMGDFAMEDEMLKAALEVRKRIGPQEQSRQDQGSHISLCMIVKDEENDLVKCIQSVKPVVDEIIVVDTGSADRTKDIATALGAKVFEFSWKNDFSAARNFSISQARGDWILVLDADEVISPLDHTSLLGLTKAGSLKAGYSLVTRNYLNTLGVTQWTANSGTYDEEAGNGWIPSEKVRLFPRDQRIHFENPVHELVEPSLERNRIPIKKCNIAVHHYGKLNEKKEERKGEDYFLLGKKKLEKSSADIWSLRELAVQANILKRYEEAVELWHQIIRLQPNLQEPYINLTSIYMNLGKFQEASATSQKAVELDPNCKEAVMNYSIAEFTLGNLKNVISALENLLSKIPEYPLAMGLLSVAYRLDGEMEKSQTLVARIKKAGFNYDEYLQNTAKNLIDLGRSDEAGLLVEMMEGKNPRVQFQGASLS
jgi:GT2 family glycosyltransferase/predicted Zn-dependent protease